MEYSKLTDGILIAVQPVYQPVNSQPIEARFQFSYDVTIDNLNGFPIKVVRRITDTKNAHGERKQGNTCGIFGVQEVIMPYKEFSYRGGIMLDTALGSFRITFEFLNVNAEETIVAKSPVITLESCIACN